MRFALALCLISTPVLADEYIAFHSPSGNIHCGLTVSADYTGARCDIFQITAQSFTSPPADCEFEGYLACVSDTVADDAGLEVGYGQEVSLGGITCSSAQSGMTCTNDSGHGFTVSKAKQSVF